MSPTAAPPTPQEILRKLSVHSVSRVKPSNLSGTGPVSGTESDSDSILTPDVSVPHAGGGGGSSHNAAGGGGGGGTSSSQPPLSSIAERRSDSGEDTEDEVAVEGGWKTADVRANRRRNSVDESVIKAGYLWKKGERRKTWKKRWFVLRPAHIAYYKSSAEYQLLRLLELSDVHSCTQVNLKRHDNTFGLISPLWVKAIEEARETLLATSTQTSAATPIPIPESKSKSRGAAPSSLLTSGGALSPSQGSIQLSYSPNQMGYPIHAITSSDSEDAGASMQAGGYSSPTQAAFSLSPAKGPSQPQKDPTKVVLSGYLMKCGSKRRNWRKRWFVLTGEKLVYSGSHMDTKPHRQFPFNDILDALEYDLPTSMHRQAPSTPLVATTPYGGGEVDEVNSTHTFKIVTTKRTLLLCAPSEDDEIKWLGAIRALIARRAELGQVPGKVSKSLSSGHSPQPGNPRHEGGTAAATAAGPIVAGTGSSTTAPSSGGMKSKVRRLSGAGSIGYDQREMKAS
ncbi:hypothetical protein M413DRAFT_446908 [Hebeloma cylindrosporum]|uniref:PH domain-containing protein n=1 Tax=Hebeloma cylindrosporum TaxID=76867 RepID=A0A0C3C730_HEBCY|nr:hypothetical protein M413DRAFT_446908 [Hebeloma cylindrosporum h7]